MLGNDCGFDLLDNYPYLMTPFTLLAIAKICCQLFMKICSISSYIKANYTFETSMKNYKIYSKIFYGFFYFVKWISVFQTNETQNK